MSNFGLDQGKVKESVLWKNINLIDKNIDRTKSCMTKLINLASDFKSFQCKSAVFSSSVFSGTNISFHA